jgi:PhnB protein
VKQELIPCLSFNGRCEEHATLAMDGRIVQGADAPPRQYRKPQGFSLSIRIGDAAEAERIFKTLAENGNVEKPLQETFWALRFGSLVDQFGTPWAINCEKQ